MRKLIMLFVLLGIVNTVEAQFWGGFLQGALMGAQNAMRQQQIRQQQERERRRQEEANRIDKELEIETGFKWYSTKQNGKYGAEDYYHNTLIPLSRGYDFICFHPKYGHVGYFGVKKNGKEGACDITGMEILSTSYESVIYSSDGFNYKSSSGSYIPTGWYLDSEGKATKEVPINRDLKTESDGFKWYLVHQGERYGAEDYMNHTLIPLNREYTKIYYRAEEGHKGYFNVYKDNKEGACDLTGKEIISPIYESLIYFSNGFEYKNSEGKWIALGWMLDSEGNGIRGTKEEITNNGVKYYIVSRDGFYGLTDANGKEIVPMKMDKIELAGGNRLKYKANDSWGMMNFLGKILIPTSRGYTSIGEFKTFNKRFPYTMNGYKGECDINGRQVSKIKVSNPSSTKTISSINSSAYSDAKLLGFKGKVKSCRIGQAYWLANCISFNDYVFEMRFSPDGVFSFKANSGYDALIKRDSNNRILEIGGKSKFGESTWKISFSNNRISKISTKIMGQVVSESYTYDSTNKIIRAELTWEKNGNIEQRKTITYEYKKTDSKGNWIERVAKSNSGESKEETRTIEYY